MSDPSPPIPSLAQPPKVYRAMKRDPADNLPVTGSTSSAQLGVRPRIDISVDDAGNVTLDGSGMSVVPNWRTLKHTRIPRRLRSLVGEEGASAPNSISCFSMGVGPFQKGILARGLELIPDPGKRPVSHGVIAPAEVVVLNEYQTDLANTRPEWRIDET